MRCSKGELEVKKYSDLKLSPIPKDLLEDLKRLFPNRWPKEKEDERRIWMNAGKQELIEFIQLQYNLQQQAAKEVDGSDGPMPLSSIINKP